MALAISEHASQISSRAFANLLSYRHSPCPSPFQDVKVWLTVGSKTEGTEVFHICTFTNLRTEAELHMILCMLLFWSILATPETFLCFMKAMPTDLSAFWLVGSVWLKEEIPLVIDAVPFSLYVSQLMSNVYFPVFCVYICMKWTISDDAHCGK